MNSRWIPLLAALGLALGSFRALPQDPPTPPALPAAAEPAAPAANAAVPDDPDAPAETPKPRSSKHRKKDRTTGRDVHLSFADYVLKPGEKVHDVIVQFGSARIEGDVDGDLVVVFGKATVLGRVAGDVVNVGSGLVIEDGARIGGDAVGVGYGITRGTDGVVGGEVVNVGFTRFPAGIRTRVEQYIERCLLLGRPLAPGLGWLWIGWGAVLLLHALLALLFPSAVRKILRTMEERPGGTALLGILGLPLLLVGLTLVSATVVLVLALPFLFAAIVVGLLLARTAIYQYLGRRILALFGIADAHGLLPFAVGAGITTGLFLVPVLGLFVWLLFGLWAIGGLMLTVFSRENSRNGKKRTDAPVAGDREVVLPVVAPAPVSAPVAITPTAFGISEPGPEPALGFAAAAATGTTATGFGSPAEPTAAPAAPTLDAAAIETAPRAPFGKRIAALAVDWLPILIVAGNVPDRLFFLDLGDHGGWIRVLLAVAYFTVMLVWRGTTLGGILFGIRVVRMDGRPMTRDVALVRAAAAVLSGLALGLGWFWSLWDPRGQTWHDKLAGTLVIRDENPRSLV